MFSPATEERFQQLIRLYPQKRSALIPMLLLAQQEAGYITPEAMEHIGSLLGLTASDVESTLTFYTLLRRKPVGKYHILICTNLACMLRGSDDIEATVKRLLGVELGEVTKDGLFSAIEFECLGSCTTAPAIQVNGEFHENLTPGRVEELIGELRQRG
ncbi:MAG TPA: NAD(P)H-dependent oxidoreductase subunit E [Terriglobia bacterium]|nr:NAD(P)H-dependent oxidoreductase subunit E [Terriglobia bacterium]